MTKRTDKHLSLAIGQSISKKRLSKGLTQAQVAEKIGVSNDAISRMERGTIMPTIKRLNQLATLFDCQTAELLQQSSPLISDQSQYVYELLAQLDDTDRLKLIAIIEQMVDWRINHKS